MANGKSEGKGKADGKLNTEKAVALGLCWSEAQCDEFAAKMEASGFHRGNEYTVGELLTAKHIGYDDAMFAVCREEVTPTKVLRDFATLVAVEALKVVIRGLPNHAPFKKAVAFLQEGDADDRPEELAEHSETVQKFMVSALVIEGVGDWTQPDKIAEYELLLKACKGIRAALKPNAGEAAYASALHAYRSVKGEYRDNLSKRHRGQLAKIHRDQT
jgi:hypothetical protein